MIRKAGSALRRGWTTGACATAATKTAYTALLTGAFPDPVAITLPNGETPAFALAREELAADHASAGIVKDAGDDPDVTHGALILATVRKGAAGSGVVFRAGEGVGTITKPGLPLAPGEPAINPKPREMMRQAVAEVVRAHGGSGDVDIEISVPGGETLARKTWNPRLGIVGGISILGTTGIVIPYSCSAWIHSIQRGIDVARAEGLRHVAGCTGSTSEHAIRRIHGLPETALLDMGDFAGGLLKYLRRHPLPRLTIAGGFAKIAKLAQGHLDLHSGRSQVDREWLAERFRELGADKIIVAKARTANSALETLELARAAGYPIGDCIAARAWAVASGVLEGAPVTIDIMIFDRQGELVGKSNG